MMYLHFSASYYSQCSWLSAHTHTKTEQNKTPKPHTKKEKKINQKANKLSKSVYAVDQVFPNKGLQNASAGWKHRKAKKMLFTLSSVHNTGVLCHHYFNHYIRTLEVQKESVFLMVPQ